MAKSEIKILHVINRLDQGGASFGLLNQIVDGPKGFSHSILSLKPSTMAQTQYCRQHRIPLFIDTYNDHDLTDFLSSFDLIQIEWWNTPLLVDFILNRPLGAVRLLLNSRAHFDAPYMCPSPLILSRLSTLSVTTPSAALNPAFKECWAMINTEKGIEDHRVPCLFSALSQHTRATTSNFSSLPFKKQPTGFSLGYLGTIETIKMHDQIIKMIAELMSRHAELVFYFAGNGHLDFLRKQFKALGLEKRVHFLGFTARPEEFLKEIDLLFYPLNPYTYATSEKVVQEAMHVGCPVAALPYGGLKDILNKENSVLAESVSDLIEKTSFYIKNPTELSEKSFKAKESLRDILQNYNLNETAATLWRKTADFPKIKITPLKLNLEQLFHASFLPQACPLPVEHSQNRNHYDLVGRFVLEEYF